MDMIKRQMRPFFLTDLQDEINRLFDISAPSRGKGVSELMGDFLPPIDIKDEKHHYLISVDLPGVDPKMIEITMIDNTLCVKGNKESEKKDEKEGFVRIERAKGAFCRQFTLPEVVDSEHISAKSKHGVLEITIPKSKRNGSRKIDVEVEA